MKQEAALVPSHRKDFESRFKSGGWTAPARSPQHLKTRFRPKAAALDVYLLKDFLPSTHPIPPSPNPLCPTPLPFSSSDAGFPGLRRHRYDTVLSLGRSAGPLTAASVRKECHVSAAGSCVRLPGKYRKSDFWKLIFEKVQQFPTFHWNDLLPHRWLVRCNPLIRTPLSLIGHKFPFFFRA